jgi:hypothetical protein
MESAEEDVQRAFCGQHHKHLHSTLAVTLAALPRLLYSSISIFNRLSFNKVIPFPLP